MPLLCSTDAQRARSLAIRPTLALVVALALPLLGACGGGTTSSAPGFDASSEPDAGLATPDAAVATPEASPAPDAEVTPPAVDAAPATRNATCTPLNQQTGTAVNTTHGRLDGTLVYVVGVGQGSACNGDYSHVHLQVLVSGHVYDVAVDIGKTTDEVGLYEESIAVPGGAWAEGWHGADSLAYPSLGVHSTSLPLVAPTTLGTQVVSLLATTSKISIFCTGYTQGNGCHDVHYKDGSGGDGEIVLDPTSAMSPVLFFRFSTPTF